MKKLNSFLYTRGKYCRKRRYVVDNDADNEFLYSKGLYHTKIKREDLSEDYIEFKSRAIWYLTGYIKTSDVIDIGYESLKINHLFKDDYLYISYKEKLKQCERREGYYEYINYDVRICGNSIISILLGIEKFSNVDTSKVRKQILEKFNWWKENYPSDYEQSFKNKEIDIFEKYK